MVWVILALDGFLDLSIFCAPDPVYGHLDVEGYTISGNTEPDVSLKVE